MFKARCVLHVSSIFLLSFVSIYVSLFVQKWMHFLSIVFAPTHSIFFLVHQYQSFFSTFFSPHRNFSILLFSLRLISFHRFSLPYLLLHTSPSSPLLILIPIFLPYHLSSLFPTLYTGEPEDGMVVCKIGGPAYRIGMGGGAASSR